jgi:hypothetical protein
MPVRVAVAGLDRGRDVVRNGRRNSDDVREQIANDAVRNTLGELLPDQHA